MAPPIVVVGTCIAAAAAAGLAFEVCFLKQWREENWEYFSQDFESKVDHFKREFNENMDTIDRKVRRALRPGEDRDEEGGHQETIDQIEAFELAERQKEQQAQRLKVQMQDEANRAHASSSALQSQDDSGLRSRQRPTHDTNWLEDDHQAMEAATGDAREQVLPSRSSDPSEDHPSGSDFTDYSHPSASITNQGLGQQNAGRDDSFSQSRPAGPSSPAPSTLDGFSDAREDEDFALSPPSMSSPQRALSDHSQSEAFEDNLASRGDLSDSNGFETLDDSHRIQGPSSDGGTSGWTGCERSDYSSSEGGLGADWQQLDTSDDDDDDFSEGRQQNQALQRR